MLLELSLSESGLNYCGTKFKDYSYGGLWCDCQ